MDLRPCGELAPTVAALAALADSPSRLTGIGHLRGHETNRLHALETRMSKRGGQVRQQEDGLTIRPRKLEGGRWRSYADHRMATAGAIIGLRVPGVEVDDVSSTSKTLPRFPGMWKSMM